MSLFKKGKNIILEKKDNFLINTVTNEKVGRVEGNKIIFIKSLPERNYMMRNKGELYEEIKISHIIDNCNSCI